MKVSAEIAEAMKAFDDLGKEVYRLGNDLEKFGKGTGKVFDPLMDGLVKIVATLAAAGAAVAAFATATANDLNDAYSTIERRTGATGKALDGLNDTFERVAAGADDSFGEVAEVVSGLSTRMDASGKALEDISTQILDAADLTEEAADEIVASYTRMMGDWGVPAENATATLDKLYVASQRTGAKITSLAAALTQYGAPMRQLGFDLDTAIALMAKWEKEGVNMELVMGSLRIALGKFAKDGVKDTVAELKKIVAAIAEAGTTGEANALALETFGARAGADMAAAIREGRFEVDELVTALQASNGAIAETAEKTKTWGEKVGELKNQIALVLQPLGEFVLSGLSGIKDLASVFAEWAKQTDLVGKAVSAFAEGLGLAVPKAEDLKAALEDIDIATVVDDFRKAGETIRDTVQMIGKAFGELADAVPWEWLLEHIKEITAVIVVGWAAGKVAAIGGAIKILGTAFHSLAGGIGAAAVALKGTALASLLGIGGGSATAAGAAMTATFAGALAFLLAFPDATDAETESLEDMQAAIEGNEEALKRLPPEVQKWIKETYNVGDAADEAKSKFVQMFEDSVEAGKKLPPVLKEVKDELEIKPTFAQNVAGAITESLQTFIEAVNTLRSQSKEMIGTFGLNAAEAGDALKESIRKKADDTAADLVKKFDNPVLKQLFGKALQNLGKEGGDAMLQEIGTALTAAETKLGDFKARMDEYTKQLKEMTDKEAAGEAYVSSIWGDKTTYAVKSGMKYEDPKKGSYEERFNEPVYEYKTLTKPVEEAAKALGGSDSMGSAIDSMIQKLSRGLETFDASKLTVPIQQALTGIESSGQTAGGSAGNKFGQAFASNATAAVEQVVRAIENIPNVVQVTVQKKTAGGASGLAGQIAAAARG